MEAFEKIAGKSIFLIVFILNGYHLRVLPPIFDLILSAQNFQKILNVYNQPVCTQITNYIYHSDIYDEEARGLSQFNEYY